MIAVSSSHRQAPSKGALTDSKAQKGTGHPSGPADRRAAAAGSAATQFSAGEVKCGRKAGEARDKDIGRMVVCESNILKQIFKIIYYIYFFKN